MGWGVSTSYPQKETLFDTISLTQSSSATPHQSTTTEAPTKKEPNLWFPFENTDAYSSRSTSARSDKNLLLSPFATPPLPSSIAHEKKTSTASLSAVLAGGGSCRFYPASDKHDLFSSYANIVSEASSSSRTAPALPFSPLSDASSPSIPTHHRSITGLPFSPSLSDGPSPGAAHHHHHHSVSHHSQMHQSGGLGSHSAAAHTLFGSPFAPMSPYSLLQNMGYDPAAAAAVAAAAAAGKARCALPSPTIFPPTPPPSAPWNPWSGF